MSDFIEESTKLLYSPISIHAFIQYAGIRFKFFTGFENAAIALLDEDHSVHKEHCG